MREVCSRLQKPVKTLQQCSAHAVEVRGRIGLLLYIMYSKLQWSRQEVIKAWIALSQSSKDKNGFILAWARNWKKLPITTKCIYSSNFKGRV